MRIGSADMLLLGWSK